MKSSLENIVVELLSLWMKDRYQIFILLLSFIAGVLSLLFLGHDAIREFLLLFYNFSERLIGSLSFTDYAYAKTPAPTANGDQSSASNLLNFLFTFGVFVAFFWSFIVSLHNPSTAKRQSAKSFANLFGGILIGSAKGTLGIG